MKVSRRAQFLLELPAISFSPGVKCFHAVTGYAVLADN
jgi:hypothetical protein